MNSNLIKPVLTEKQNNKSFHNQSSTNMKRNMASLDNSLDQDGITSHQSTKLMDISG